jgi:hypothetical protein
LLSRDSRFVEKSYLSKQMKRNLEGDKEVLVVPRHVWKDLVFPMIGARFMLLTRTVCMEWNEIIPSTIRSLASPEATNELKDFSPFTSLTSIMLNDTFTKEVFLGSGCRNMLGRLTSMRVDLNTLGESFYKKVFRYTTNLTSLYYTGRVASYYEIPMLTTLKHLTVDGVFGKQCYEGLASMTQLVSLHMENNYNDAEKMEALDKSLCNLTGLKYLSLRVRQSDFSYIKELTRLEYLGLNDCHTDNDVLKTDIQKLTNLYAIQFLSVSAVYDVDWILSLRSLKHIQFYGGLPVLKFGDNTCNPDYIRLQPWLSYLHSNFQPLITSITSIPPTTNIWFTINYDNVDGISNISCNTMATNYIRAIRTIIKREGMPHRDPSLFTSYLYHVGLGLDKF